MLYKINLLLLIFLLLCYIQSILSNPDAKRLYDDLLSNYNRLIRPVSNNTDTVLVKLGLRLSQLIDLVRLNDLYCRMLLTLVIFVSEFKRSDFNYKRLVRTCKFS